MVNLVLVLNVRHSDLINLFITSLEVLQDPYPFFSYSSCKTGKFLPYSFLYMVWRLGSMGTSINDTQLPDTLLKWRITLNYFHLSKFRHWGKQQPKKQTKSQKVYFLILQFFLRTRWKSLLLLNQKPVVVFYVRSLHITFLHQDNLYIYMCKKKLFL